MIYITIFGIAALIAVIFAFKEGYRLGKGDSVKAEIKTPVLTVVKDKLSSMFNSDNNEYLDDEAVRKINIELENIDNFGTNKPQKEVK